MKISKLVVGAALCASGFLACPAIADEGMWLLNKPPVDVLKSRYGFTPTPEWLEAMQKSSVRIGASGSLVSADGLVMTNHHVASDAVAKLSSEGNDLLEKGFYARTREEELKCPGQEVSILWTIEDVTDKVNGAVSQGMSPAEANIARRKAMSTLEKQNQDATGLTSQVVTLYQGGRYHLYGYKRFTDVRLVFAPEQAIAFFGGDTDNFEYPRFDLDVAFLRIYENGQPYKAEHYLRWSQGSNDGELAFIFGHPGRTNRLYTVDHLKHLRDFSTPRRLQQLCQREVEVQVFCGRSAEHQRIGKDELFGLANSRKNLTGQVAGLLDPTLFAKKSQEEARLRSAYQQQNPSAAADPWDRLAKALAGSREFSPRQGAIDATFRSDLSRTARTLVRLAEEKPKPNGERLREFRDTALPSVMNNLYSPEPIYDIQQIDQIASGLTYMATTLGADDPVVVATLAGKSPRARAHELVTGTKLKDIAERKRLAEGGAEAIAQSNDPLILLARSLDAESRSLRKRSEDEVEAVERECYAQIAAAKFALEGDSVYPDATGTLRMAFGPIKGYTDGGKPVAPYTKVAGLYQRADERKGQAGFELPQRWIDRKTRINLDTPFNFVCTAETIGGNSGSPVVNTRGEVIGLVFDGNIYSLTTGFAYDDVVSRSVSVDSRAIIEALRNVYDAGPPADEILGKGKAAASAR